MSSIKVELVDYMGSDLTVANVARVSFDKWKEEFDNKDERLINFLAKHRHETPFRHCQISVRCEAPIFIARQLGKHQVGMSWNEVSRRYVDQGIKFFKQKEWRKRPEGGIKQGSSSDVVQFLDGTPVETCVNLFEQRALHLYEEMLKAGVAPELARQILPQSMMTTWIWTGSLTSFLHVYKLRIDGHAQVEAQEFARALEAAIQPLFPISWEALKGATMDNTDGPVA